MHQHDKVCPLNVKAPVEASPHAWKEASLLTSVSQGHTLMFHYSISAHAFNQENDILLTCLWHGCLSPLFSPLL